VTTILIELLFFMLLLCVPVGSTKERFKNALPFVLAGMVVVIWPVRVIAQAPRAFFLNLVKIPMLYGQWLRDIGMVHDKFALTFACLTMPGYFVLIVLVVYLYLGLFLLRHRLKITDGINLLLAALPPVIFFIIALMPPTIWRQYLAVPVPFLLISLAFPLLYLRKLTDKAGISRRFKMATAIMFVCTFVAIFSYPIVLYRIPIALVPEKWVPIEIHKVSEDIAAKTNAPKQILTLAPLLALEGGGQIYTELSAGAIIYRIADSLSAEERQITHTAGVETLAETIKKNPPSAVILHVEMGRLEEPIYKSVVTPDWKIKDYENGPIAYFRP